MFSDKEHGQDQEDEEETAENDCQALTEPNI